VSSHFDKAFLEFHRNLARHNDRAWFNANKTIYEAKVKVPMLDFIVELQPGLAKVSKYIVADPRPVGGSMFRIYRDVRFSKDKSPYKTATTAHFHHKNAANKGHVGSAPSLYLHLEPNNSFLGAGVWHPDAGAAHQIRAAITKSPKIWTQVKGRMELIGDAYKKVPKGFDPEHLLSEDLKRKDFIARFAFTDAQVTSPKFKQTLLANAVKAKPFLKFLANALSVPW
jgi:uncharacterized protein (TIGR02453 family)